MTNIEYEYASILLQHWEFIRNNYEIDLNKIFQKIREINERVDSTLIL